MGKYKKYAKVEKNLDQPNKFSLNKNKSNNSNQNNKIVIKNREINNKNELYNSKNRNAIKNDESSLKEILLDIYDAMKYFFIMCRNFILPSGIPFKIFISFLLLELLYQGIIIYIIKTVIFTLIKYFSIRQRLTNIYIYIMSYVQMIYIFLCEGLLIFRFITFKIFLYKKFNWLINILTCVIIIMNAISINEINSKVYRFYGKNNGIILQDRKNVNKGEYVKEYINLYVDKNEDIRFYETCYEIKFHNIIVDRFKERLKNYKWHFDNNLNIHIGCKNLSFPNKSVIEHLSKSYLNCPKGDINTSPDFCVSSKYRQKRFYSHLKMTSQLFLIGHIFSLENQLN